jgi:uracil-DNA glycosylase
MQVQSPGHHCPIIFHSTMLTPIPAALLDTITLADPSWHAVLLRGLMAAAAADPQYFTSLAVQHYLPTERRLLAAFAQPLDRVRYVLVGEGPYPRAESATGVCFMDGAVGSLWSAEAGGGLSKPVNRATSLRNFMKMLLVADGQLTAANSNAQALASIAARARASASTVIQTLRELQDNLTRQGFLLLNAALVFRPHVPPAIEAKAWQPFVNVILESLLQRPAPAPTLVLWGKIAEQISRLPASTQFPRAVAEHPYNLSFISNQDMQALFRPMHLLQKRN